MNDELNDGADEFGAADFADRPLPPRVSRTSRIAIVAALLAVLAMVAAGLVIGAGGGDAAVFIDGSSGSEHRM